MNKLLLAVALIAIAADVYSGQKYVSTQGRDSSSGSFSDPWRTIQYAAENAVADDTVFILGGTYHERVVILSGGSLQSGYVTYMPYDTQRAILSADSIAGQDVLLIDNTQYIRILGLEIQNNRIDDGTNILDGGAGIRIRGICNNIALSGNTIHDISGIRPQGIALTAGDSAGSIQYVRMIGNTIHSIFTDTVNGSYGGSGIRLTGGCDSITIARNTIRDVRSRYDSLGGAMAITVYGTSDISPITRLLIDGNTLHDCEPARSEALAISGNVTRFKLVYNTIYNMNNIGIGLSGGYGICPDPSFDYPRYGEIRWNTVYTCETRFEEGHCAGIYVDGAKNIVVEANRSFLNDIGIAVNAEVVGTTCDSITVRSNVLWGNGRAGLAFGGDGIGVTKGGDLDTSGVVMFCSFSHNTIFDNNRRYVGQGEISIEDSAFHCTVQNNIIASTNDTLMFSSADIVGQSVLFDYNLWNGKSGADSATFRMNGNKGADYTSFSQYRNATGSDPNSLYANPGFVDTVSHPPDLHITPLSVATNRGNPGFIPGDQEFDIDEDQRLIGGRVDIGADEVVVPNNVVESSRAVGFRLFANYPNPFNPSTTIKFSLPERGRTLLEIYDVLGRKVATLLDDVRDAGIHLVRFDSHALSSGTYFCRLVSDKHAQTTALLLLK